MLNPAPIRLGLLVLALFSITAPWCTTTAHAHRLLLMAWVQGDRLVVETAFGTGQIGANMAITVQDAVTGDVLLSGTTDAQGLYEVALPATALERRAPLLVQATDGAGHLAEQTIAPDELPALDIPSTASPSPPEVTGLPEQLPDQLPDQLSMLLQQAVAEAVRQEIAPLRREILALSQRGPGIPEIVGGIGWIVGLAGLGALLLRRKTATTSRPGDR
ncbi:nickel transport protein [Desulfonatronum zhilinae]|nr:nickel transport protein [Desulfonatronum zhilinae]